MIPKKRVSASRISLGQVSILLVSGCSFEVDVLGPLPDHGVVSILLVSGYGFEEFFGLLFVRQRVVVSTLLVSGYGSEGIRLDGLLVWGGYFQSCLSQEVVPKFPFLSVSMVLVLFQSCLSQEVVPKYCSGQCEFIEINVSILL